MYKKSFPILIKKIDRKTLIYFDSACTYLKNYKTIESINEYYTNFSCCSGDRESSFLGSILLNKIEDTRREVKKFIGAKNEDYVIFTSGATDGINKFIFSLNEKEIKTIITSDLEHNSNYLPQLEYSKQKGIIFKIFSYSYIINLELLEKKLKNIKGPFLFCFTHSSNIIGGTFDIKNISNLVHKYGGYILIDDAQFVSHNSENVIENDIDFLVFSAHKLGGPTGIGILYIKKGLEKLIKYSNKLGGGTIKTLINSEVNYKGLPYFLEGGVQDFAGVLGLKGCIEYYSNIGYENISNYIKELVSYFRKVFYKNNLGDNLEVLNLDNSIIITLKPKYFNVVDFHGYCNYYLEDYIISFRVGTMCADNYINNYLNGEKNIMRLSFGIYNSKKDINIFIKELLNYIKLL